MRTALLLFSAVVVAAGLVVLARTLLAAEVLQRTNHRGVSVPVAAGVLIPVTLVVIEAVARTLEIGVSVPDPAELSGRMAVLTTALGFGLLGLFDDLAAEGEDRGFRGHIGALRSGRLTTGGLKLFGGGLLALAAVAPHSRTVGDAFLGAALVALAANLGNLFDRAPGRTTKVASILGVILVLATPSSERPLLAGTVLVLGAALGTLIPDLRERLMLGDAGSNVIGAALGVGFVLTVGRLGEAIAVVALLILNVSSERISFSRVIESVGPLRRLDELGRRPRTEAG